MSSDRRNFIKRLAVGAGAISVLPSCINSDTNSNTIHTISNDYKQHFNMCGYGAPKLDKVRVGFIGLGMRGPGAVMRMSYIEGVEIAGLCDKYTDRVEKTQQMLTDRGIEKIKSYSGSENSWKELCESDNVDLIYICTPWHLHTPMAVYAMEHGKHVAVEVPAAKTVDECWQLVETSEKTRKHCMMMENCCYDFFELLTLNMARQGYFGEIVHGEGAYIHDLRDLMVSENGYADMWRLKENVRNGNLYPTHGLGPVCQLMNINRGDQMEFLNSVSTDDFLLKKRVMEQSIENDYFDQYSDKNFRGNMNTTVVRTKLGKTIMIQHDTSSPRPYSRIHLLSGTKGMARKYPVPARISTGHKWLNQEEFEAVENQYTPEIVKRVGEMAKKVGGHGGMDFIMDWRLMDCLRNGLPLDQDVYDAALWSVIAPLSEWSVKNRSNSIDVPDFTNGAWKKNKPFDLELKKGGTTGVKNISKVKKEEQLSI